MCARYFIIIIIIVNIVIPSRIRVCVCVHICIMYDAFRMENNEGNDILFSSRHFPLVANFIFFYIYIIYSYPSAAVAGSLEYDIVARPSLVGDTHTHTHTHIHMHERTRFELGKIECWGVRAVVNFDNGVRLFSWYILYVIIIIIII